MQLKQEKEATVFTAEYAENLEQLKWIFAGTNHFGDKQYKTVATFTGKWKPVPEASWMMIPAGVVEMLLTVKSSAMEDVPAVYAIQAHHIWHESLQVPGVQPGAELRTFDCSGMIQEGTQLISYQDYFRLVVAAGTVAFGAFNYATSSAFLNKSGSTRLEFMDGQAMHMYAEYGQYLVADE